MPDWVVSKTVARLSLVVRLKQQQGIAMKPLTIAVGVSLFMLSFAGAVEAAFLQWGRALVPTTSEPRCMQIAADVARRSGLQNIHAGSVEVTGNTIDAFVVLTCVGRGAGNQSFGIVMVVADANDVAISTRERIKSIFQTSGP